MSGKLDVLYGFNEHFLYRSTARLFSPMCQMISITACFIGRNVHPLLDNQVADNKTHFGTPILFALRSYLQVLANLDFDEGDTGSQKTSRLHLIAVPPTNDR